MFKYVILATLTFVALLEGNALADSPAPNLPASPATLPAPAATSPAPITNSANLATMSGEASSATTLAQARWYDQLSLQGLVDTYFMYRLFGPFRDEVQFRAFDSEAGTFQVAYAKLGLSFKPKPVGLQLDIGFGPTADIASTDPGPSDLFKYIVQGYVSFAIPIKRPIIIDVGKFFTSTCPEFLDANLNWAYSHSFLFRYSPVTHTGIRILAPVTGWLSLQASLVNGWDSVTDGNSFKTFNFGAYLTLRNTSLAVNYYAGPEITGQNSPWRHMVDFVLSQPIGKRFAMNLDVMFGHEGNDNWYGASLQGNVSIHRFFRMSLRGEYFGDPQGNRTGVVGGVNLGEVTLTAAVPLFDHAEVRVEARQDIASKQVFRDAASNLQTTFTAAAIAWF